MKHLVWVDVETTGLNPRSGHLLELGLVVTDLDLNVVRERSWVTTAVQYDHVWVKADEYVQSMHSASGLRTAKPDVDFPGLLREMHAFLEGVEPGPMCGASVHFDRAWIAAHLPEALPLWTHRNLDVSSFYEWFRVHGIDVPKGGAGHRALADCHDAIALLRQYRGQVLP